MSKFDYIRIRQLLSPKEYLDVCEYPQNELLIENHYYLINNNTPYLITLFDSKDEETFYSEGVILNINELVFATILNLNCSVVVLGEQYDEKISNLDFKVENVSDLKNNKSKLQTLINVHPFPQYSSKIKEINLKYFEYYNHPITNDKIFLRVCFSLLKAGMLGIYRNLFFEESCLNLYIALEGLLHLLHEKFYPDEEFCMNNVKNILDNLLEDNDSIYNALKESYEFRNSIVHPEVAAYDFDSVFPIYSSEEFAENWQYAWALLKYILVDDIKILRYEINPIKYFDEYSKLFAS
jgi:hypothetical protein